MFVSSYRTALLRILGLLLLCGVLFGAYRFGYERGSGAIAHPPHALGLFNVDSSGDASMVLGDAAKTVDFGDFWKTWNVLEKNFAPTSTTTSATSTAQERVLYAIDGLVRSYNDPYTVFIPKEQADSFKESVNAEFEGIGAALEIKNGEVVITAILPDSPALRAGLKAGDRIIAVDGQPTAGQELGQIIPRIRGAKGSVVSLTIVPAKSQKGSVVSVTRGTVAIPTTATRVVSAAKSVVASVVAKASAAAAAAMPGSREEAAAKEKVAEAAKQKFFVLQLASFAKSSTDAFITDLQTFAKSDTDNLIIDLRNNPGGYLEVANDLASYFLPEGALVVTQKTGAAQDTQEYKSTGHDTIGDMTTRRIVVLVNRNSASASEILAGALQDHDVALVVGERSFGKGSVQTLVDIGSVGSLKVTIARWYTPSGRNISHTGVEPDVVVNTQDPKFASSTDPFMDAAVEALLDEKLW